MDCEASNMCGVSTPTVHWYSQTVAPDPSQSDSHQSLHLLHVLIAAPSCAYAAEFRTKYPHFTSSTLTIENEKQKSRAVTYLLDQFTARSNLATYPRLATFILPYASGYIVRSDFLRSRLHALSTTSEVVSFTDPLQYCPSHQPSASENALVDTLRTAVGVITSTVNQEFVLENFEHQLHHRLSHSWLSSYPPPKRRVALVRGRPNYRVGRAVYSAAEALGVTLVIIDEDKHWLQADTARNKQLREAFLTIDMKDDPALPCRIAQAIESYPKLIHGVFTLSDNYLVAVAQAAESIGLPTCSSSAYKTAYDKGLTRQLHAGPHEYAMVKSEQELLDRLTSEEFQPQYPLIVKPRTGGWNSQYVSKVRNREELVSAVGEVCPLYNDGVVIEPYYDGPEIDVNIVMSEGRAVFQEIVDEPPSCGDLDNQSSADFLENGMRAPSVLPGQEQKAIFDSVTKDLLKLGFVDGVFHVEARISKSSMELRNEDGLVDLVSTSPTPSSDVQCHLIEINARPPGLRAQILTHLTYGIDYFAVRILSAINDAPRMKASCHPFSLPDFPQGAQSWSQLVHLPVLRKGTAVGVAAIEHLLRQLPDVADHVAEYQCCFEPGEVLPDPANYVDVYGHCIVSSTQGRRHVTRIADTILQAYHQCGAKTTVTDQELELDLGCESVIGGGGLEDGIVSSRNERGLHALHAK